MKPFLLTLGFVAALLLISQLVMGQLIVSGRGSVGLIKAHQHSGYLTVTVSLIYVGLSLARIAGEAPRRTQRAAEGDSI